MNRLNPWQKLKSIASRGLIAALVCGLCGAPEVLAQTMSNAPPAQQQQQPAQPTQPTSAQTSKPNSSVMPDPAAGPLQPVPSSNLPDAPGASPQQQAAPATQPEPVTVPAQASDQQPRTEQPAGVGAAESGKTNGGAASRPAGTAIAPVKQRQVRSWLIKLGAIAAGGVALGVVYGLSRSTSSTPPNASAGTAAH